MLLNVETRRIEPDITVFVLSGKITLGRESQQIEELVKDAVEQGQKKVVLDISGVTYIDSTGMGIITFCCTHLTHAAGKFAVAGATGLPARLFHMTHLDTIIRLYPSVETACEAFAATAS